jgi:hypothetical protein
MNALQKSFLELTSRERWGIGPFLLRHRYLTPHLRVIQTRELGVVCVRPTTSYVLKDDRLVVVALEMAFLW